MTCHVQLHILRQHAVWFIVSFPSVGSEGDMNESSSVCGTFTFRINLVAKLAYACT